MKIGMVSEFYYPHPGGISEHIRALSTALSAAGHEVTVITSRIRGPVPMSGIPVLRLGRSCPVPYNGSLSRITLGFGLRREFRDVLQEERFDLLHVHNPLMPTLPVLALQEADCPIVATFHSAFLRDRLLCSIRHPMQRLLERLSVRIAVSRSAERSVERLFPGVYRIIPNGVDFPFFSGGSRIGHVLSSRREERSRKRILFVGAMVPRKGLPDLIEAFALLRQRRRDVDLWVVGDGPRARSMRNRVPAGLRQHVQFFGFVSREELMSCYAWADLFCAPSLGQESFGMVLVEAMAAGLPVVASDIDAYRDVITHGREGFLARTGDPQSLASALETLLSSPEQRSEYGRNGRTKAASLDWSEIARRVDAAYRNALRLPAEPAARG